jgi:nicotinamidase/pyrazinamidase
MSDALLIVDVQKDFIPPDGALVVPGGDEVIEPINQLARSADFELVVATRDWHPPNHASFRSEGGIWPEHCVRDTPGAELDGRLDKGAIHVIIDKGTAQAAPGYSAFEVEELRELLHAHGIDRVTITGLATDVCVMHTAHDALQHELQVMIPLAAVRGIDADASNRALRELTLAGATVR